LQANDGRVGKIDEIPVSTGKTDNFRPPTAALIGGVFSRQSKATGTSSFPTVSSRWAASGSSRRKSCARCAGDPPRFRLGSLRKIRFADAARLQSDLDLLRGAHLPE
jgi:hypothetical protein